MDTGRAQAFAVRGLRGTGRRSRSEELAEAAGGRSSFDVHMMQTADLLAVLLSVLNGPVGWLLLLLVAGYVTLDLLRRRRIRRKAKAGAASPPRPSEVHRVGLHHDLSQFALGLSVLWALLVGFRLYLFLLRDLPEPFSTLTALDLVLTVGTLSLWIGVYLAWRRYERRNKRS
jgi:hypothetical protein